MTRHIRDGSSVKLTKRRCPRCRRPVPARMSRHGYCCLPCLRDLGHHYMCNARQAL